jgi:LPS export ABC transporter protein LptC
MKRYSTYVLTSLLVLLIIEIIIVAPTDIEEKKIESQQEAGNGEELNDKDNIEQQIKSMHVVETSEELKSWELWAELATGFRRSNQLTLDIVKADFFSSQGTSFKVVGKSGHFFSDTKDMNIMGNVVTESSNGYVFRTEEIEYKSKTKQLISKSRVEVVGPRDVGQKPLYITGASMQANLSEGIMLIKNSVRAEKNINSVKNLVVEARSAELSSNSKAIKFSGNVTIDIEGMKISGPDALFHFDGNADILKTIEVAGGVSVKDLNKSATSNQLKINLADNKFIFDGNPRIIQDEDEVSGDRIIFLDGGKKVKIENAKVKVRGESIEKARLEKSGKSK